MAASQASNELQGDLQQLVYRPGWSSATIKDCASGQLLFKAKHPLRPLFTHRILVKNSSSQTIIQLHEKAWNSRGAWQAFAGSEGSKDPKDMLFLVKRSSFLQWNMSMHVFLGPNPDDSKSPDFMMRRKALKTSIEIYNQNEQMVAKMKPEASCSCSGAYKLQVSTGIQSEIALSLLLIVLAIDAAGAAAAGAASS